MEKQEILVTKEEFREYRNKYKLNRAELIPIFNQGPCTIDNFEIGKIETLDNQEFVRELIDNEEKFKERVKSLYEEGKITYKIYVKVFKEKENFNEKKEKSKYRKNIEPELQREINEFQKELNFSDNTLIKIFGISKGKLDEIKNGGMILESKDKYIKEMLKNKDFLIKEIENKIKKGMISKKHGDSLIDDIIFYYRKNNGKTIKETKSGRKKYLKEENGLQYRMQDKYIIKNGNSKNNESSKIDRLRKSAIKELEKEEEGKTKSYSSRERFFEVIYTEYQEGKKVDTEDINIIKNTVINHHEFISNYTLKLIVLGTLKSKGYVIASHNIKELIENIKEPQYKEKLIKYIEILQEEYKKIIIKNMQKEGRSIEEIRKKLGLSMENLNKLMDDNDERI